MSETTWRTEVYTPCTCEIAPSCIQHFYPEPISKDCGELPFPCMHPNEGASE